MKKCKSCGNQFTPKFSSFEKYCQEYDCKVAYAMEVVEKQKLAKEKKVKDEWNKEKAVLKEKLKTLGQYEAEAKTVFQKWIRMRDEGLPCISCGTTKAKSWHASHYFDCNRFSGLIFDERNVSKSCEQCNTFLHGNLIGYRLGLINRFGVEFVEKLESESDEKRVYKFTKNELIAKKLQYEIKIKEFKNK